MTPSGQKQILVAEDTDGDFFMFRQAFARAGFTHVLQRGKDGLELLAYLTGQPPYGNRSKWPFPAVLILGLLLPKLNGVGSLIYLRKELGLARPVVGRCA